MNQIQKVKVLGVRSLTDSAYVLKLERRGFEFVPGQCVNLGLPGSAVNREYSTYSAIFDSYLEFLIKKVPGGLVSESLERLKLGDEVTLDGAYGLFVLEKPEDRNRRYFFIGTGTGIAPFHSYVKSYPSLDYKILHGVRFENECYDAADYGSDRYFACVSRVGEASSARNFFGRVTDYLRLHPVDPTFYFYLCGNSSMINDVYDILRNQGVSGSQIFTEVFF